MGGDNLMLSRKIINELILWKKKDKHKSLIIYGARQVGKTFAVREFAKDYDHFVELNFIENPEFKKIFDESLDVENLKINISTYLPKANFEKGKTLILLDEIQECGEALQSLKFWSEDGRYDVIATGSALGMNYKQDISYPVGNVEYIDMQALDFEEFLWANDINEEVISLLYECYKNVSKVPAAIHEKIINLLKQYMIIGGMPEVVQAYVNSKNIQEADEIQRRIYRDYLNDIAHYAPANIRIKAQNCYKSIPIQLTKDNHKFQYGVVEKKATATKFETSIEWLNASFITKPVYVTKRIEYPMKAFVDETNFRLYMTDIGMMFAGFDFSLKKMVLGDDSLEEKALNIMLGTAKGGLYEALAADMLIKKGYKDIYFYKDVKSTAEIEFLIEYEDGVLPIEIKAGRKKANTLGNVLKQENIKKGYKLSLQNVGCTDKKITMPIYMLMFI